MVIANRSDLQTTTQDSKTIYKTIAAPVPSSSSSSSASKDDQPATFRTVTITPTHAATPAAPNAASSSQADASKGDNGLQRGAIAGAAVGGSAAVVFLGLAGFFLLRRSRRNNKQFEPTHGVETMGYFAPIGGSGAAAATTIKRDNTSASADSRMGAFGHNANLWRNSTGSLEDSSSDTNQVLRVVNPDVPEKV